MLFCARTRWLVSLLPLLLALPGCSSSSAAGGTPDGSTADARADASGTADTASPLDGSSGADTSSAQDSGATDAGADGPLPLCGADAGCVTGTLCCVNSGEGFCGHDCACWTALGCANAGQCAVATDVCCIQPTTAGCTTGTQQSVCLASCGTLTQLCDPNAAINECLVGRCATGAATLKALKLPADAGYGTCQ